AKNYIESIFKLQEISITKFIDTGNYIIDNIVNFKLNEAFNKGIKINATAKVPYDIQISEFHMVSILGNIIQNAIEANDKVKENKFINFEITYKLNKIFITVSNRFDKKIIIKENKLITTKYEKNEHGIGINNVLNFIEKYNGILEYKCNDDIFTVEILLFI
ncbi:ATP-binding protein, partial [uncultured Tyzzerella sp.]|uniref:ATP-binding protein n=1 Tax=uncultured Tyzzerella sp. TaxID=2321398 RepID=UPI0029432614